MFPIYLIELLLKCNEISDETYMFMYGDPY